MDQPDRKPLQIQIQLTLKDYLQAQNTHMGATRWFFRVQGTIMMLAGISYHFIQLNLAVGLGLIALGAFFAFASPITLRRNFKSNKKLSSPSTLALAADGIDWVSPDSESHVKWSAYIHFVETTDLFLLYSQPRIFHAIPKRFFSAAQLEEFRSLLHANVASKPKSKGMSAKWIGFWILIGVAAALLWMVIKNN